MTSERNVREGEDEHEKLGILSTRDRGEYFKAVADLSFAGDSFLTVSGKETTMAWVSPGQQPLQSLDLWYVDGEGGGKEVRPVP